MLEIEQRAQRTFEAVAEAGDYLPFELCLEASRLGFVGRQLEKLAAAVEALLNDRT